jgi:uncharacterized protein (DUF2384 family)
MSSGLRNRSIEHKKSYEKTIARAEKLSEEERMRLARKVLMAAVQVAQPKK